MLQVPRDIQVAFDRRIEEALVGAPDLPEVAEVLSGFLLEIATRRIAWQLTKVKRNYNIKL
jgi:hypothetical protein